MPKTISQKLYPQLPAEDRMADTLSEECDPKLPIESDASNTFEKNNQNIYFAINYQQNSQPEKRKLVCLLLNEGKLRLKKFNHEEFEKQVNLQAGQVFLNKDLIQLVFYVKKDKQNQCFDEIAKILKISGDLENKKKIQDIREHFNKTGDTVRAFINYREMKRSFDEKTGEYIHHSVMDLDKIFVEVETKFNDYKTNYDEKPEYTNTLNEMKKIVDEMKTIHTQNKTDFEHLRTGTVNAVMTSFERLVKEFDEKSNQLTLINTTLNDHAKREQLENKAILFKEDCENILSSERVATEEIFEEKREIKNNVELLLISIQSLSGQDNISVAIEGLEKKLDSLQEKYAALKMNIDRFKNYSIKTDEKNNHHEQLNEIWQKDIQPLSESIQNHASKTSEVKKRILNEILTYLKEIKDKIIAHIPLDEIKEGVETVKKLIQLNASELAVARGFFSNSGKSVSLVSTLDLKLEKLAETMAVNEHTMSSDLKK
ncbi:hypothetical protein [Rickettsiella grylli]|uniref:Uncharacterized protein n=1 Tax=Rickettsiella grylli TaxID=59196 RepID=A8PL68_9COXI|nr:hypothetical protein [Rickettsiella grylli]EDP46022.1 hypothetical protein RICGR_0247 [Rickettsiella grylli]